MKSLLHKPYLLVLFWMGGIFFFSTDVGSVQRTGAILVPLIRFFAPDITPQGLALCVTVIRKTSHVVEYAILSILWCRALRGTRWGSTWTSVACATLISCLYAELDEFHQKFVPSRTGSFGDVGFDSAGALLGSILWAGAIRRHSLSARVPIKIKFFGWWFLWGIFSAIMLLIVFKGGPLSFSQMLLLITGIGCLTGTVGYHVGHR